ECHTRLTVVEVIFHDRAPIPQPGLVKRATGWSAGHVQSVEFCLGFRSGPPDKWRRVHRSPHHAPSMAGRAGPAVRAGGRGRAPGPAAGLARAGEGVHPFLVRSATMMDTVRTLLGRVRPRRAARPPRRARPALDELGRRDVPATFNVTSGADSGPGTLRDAID